MSSNSSHFEPCFAKQPRVRFAGWRGGASADASNERYERNASPVCLFHCFVNSSARDSARRNWLDLRNIRNSALRLTMRTMVGARSKRSAASAQCCSNWQKRNHQFAEAFVKWRTKIMDSRGTNAVVRPVYLVKRICDRDNGMRFIWPRRSPSAGKECIVAKVSPSRLLGFLLDLACRFLLLNQPPPSPTLG